MATVSLSCNCAKEIFKLMVKIINLLAIIIIGNARHQEVQRRALMNNQYTFGISLKPDSLFPEAIPTRAFAELLIEYDNIIRSLPNSKTDESKKESTIAPYEISSVRRGSLHCEFSTESQEVKTGWRNFTKALKNKDFSSLNEETKESLRAILKKHKFHRIISEYWQFNDNANKENLAVVTQSTSIDAISTSTPLKYQEETTLYGELIRIGGDKSASANIRFLDGKTLTCSVKSTKLATAIAPLLYQLIGVSGIATWSQDDSSLLQFQINELTEYWDTPITEVMDELRENVGHHFRDVSDIEAYVAELRGRDNN
ncbi:MAG: hypothetical protein OXG02_11875 [Chloroflexi bacterium]|nr:hypothetical protein [Chloroflexota bacterium]